MKKFNTILAALLVCGVAAIQAGQLSTTWTLRNVVDPPDLRDGLNADAQAADARLDTIETAVRSATLISNKYLKVWMANGNLTVSNVTAAAAIPVTSGGSGAATFTDGGILLGSGTGAFTALGVAANGQIPIGDGTTDPVLATITATAGETEISNGAGTITVGLPSAVTGVTTISNKYMKVWNPNGTLAATNPVFAGSVTIAEGALTDSTVVSADIKADTIVDADINSSAAIALSKLAGGAVKNGTASTSDLRIRYGTATNGQAVAWGETFTTVVFADIVDTNGTNAYFSAITTSGGTASVAKPHTNRWFVIGL